MEKVSIHIQPHRITDLVALKEKGARVTCDTSFEVIPVDFQHRDNPYQAHVFLCYFTGKAEDKEFLFRKCYARGCSNNLCPHVSQAIMIANRYLQRDYRLLKNAGIEINERLFTLEDMLVKFDGYTEEHGPTLTIDDFINIAREENDVTVEIVTEYIPAVEHFSNYKNAQTFLIANFTVTCFGRNYETQQCLACYASGKETDEKKRTVEIANARLERVYKDFDQNSVNYRKKYFS